MAQPFDPRTAQLTGEVFPVAEGVSTNNAYMPVSASDNGLLLYWTGGGGGAVGTNQIVWYDRGGKTEETVGTTSNVLAPAISPDEKTIVFSRGTGANRDIWLRDLVRGNERRLTTDAFTNFSPYWSPYGDRIVYRSNRGGHPGDLYLRASNGSGMDELLLSTPNQKIINQWSRDGRFIVYEEQDPKTKWDLWYLSIGKTSDSKERKAMPFLHSEFNELYGQLSPDSRWMAYTSDVSGNREVYVQPFPAADDEIRISTAGGEQPRWSRDGTELFYLAADGKLTVVPITVAAGPKPSLRAGAPIALFDAHIAGTNAAYNYDVTGNGRRFLVITPAAASAAGGIAPINVRVNWNPESKR
jgi:Tol biopolymer transport system component